MNSYEIKPGTSECVCGGNCTGEGAIKGAVATDAAPRSRDRKDYEILPASPSLAPWSGMTGSLGGVTYGLGPSSMPTSNLCVTLANQIATISATIGARWAAIRAVLGPDADRLHRLWQIAQRGCMPQSARDPCQVFWDAWEASPLEGPGVSIRNALWHVWNACTLNPSLHAGALGPNGFFCYLLRENARRVERGFAARGMTSPPFSYEHDIEPLEREVDGLRAMLQECLNGRSGLGSLVTCDLIGSSGCRNGRATCTYGGDCGASCTRSVSCNPGDHTAPCPSTANC